MVWSLATTEAGFAEFFVSAADATALHVVPDEETSGVDVFSTPESLSLAIFVDVDDPNIKRGKLYSSCDRVNGPRVSNNLNIF